MGIVHPGAPRKLTLAVKDMVGARVFVETGTCTGATARWAASNFDRVISIEIEPRLYLAAAESLRDCANVDLRCGPSEAVLKTALIGLPGPAILWLDAHWSGDGTGGEHNECPLLEEIRIIDDRCADHVIMIDDARLFLNSPPRPHKPEHWPSFAQVMAALRASAPAAYVVIHDDVIVRIGTKFRDALDGFLQTCSPAVDARTENHPV